MIKKSAGSRATEVHLAIRYVTEEIVGTSETCAPTEITELMAPTGTLRAVINLGNPVLAQLRDRRPTGITVTLAEELARWLRVDVEFTCVDAARLSYDAMIARRADICFLADEAARREHLVFTPPYLSLDGVFAARQDASFEAAAEVDRADTSISVKLGSAYDLFLSRTIEHATIHRGATETELFMSDQLDVVAGIRQPVTAFAAQENLRVLEPPFMSIHQAIGLHRDTEPHVFSAVSDWLEHAKSSTPVRQHIEASLNSF